MLVKIYHSLLTVIPAQAGIQPLSRVGGGMSLVRAAARIGWIPAYAGMTAILDKA
jgi:hypothetical protein